MKKILKNSYIALMAVLALTFSACTEKVEYTPAQVPASEQVFFSNTNSAKIELLREATEFSITLKRNNAGGELVIPIKFTGDSLANVLCNAPESVKFDSAAVEANYVITLNDLAAFVDGEDGSGSGYDQFFNATLAIEDTLNIYTTPYADAEFSFQAGVPAPWSEWAPISGHETGTYNFALYVSGAYPISVSYREHMLDETRAQFMLHITEIGANEDMIVDYNKETHACEVGIHYFLDNANYGPVFVSDFPHNPFDLNGDGERETYEEHPCTFDPETGLFSFDLVYFVYTGLGSSASGTFGYGKETVLLDGFVQYDYNYSMNFVGHYIDNTGTDNAVISAALGSDLTQLAIKLISEEEDITTTFAGMLSGEVACDTLTKSGYMAYPMTASGNYVVIAIPYDKDGAAITDAASTIDFEFFLAGEENPWESLGMATYTDDIMSVYLTEPANHSYPVEVRENKDQPGLYRIINPYAFFGADTSKEHYIEIDATDPEGVWINGLYEIGLDIGAGPISVTSYAWYLLSNTPDATIADAKEAGWCGTLADGVITFPVKGIIYDMGGLRYGNTNGAFKLDMNNMTPVGGEEEAQPAKAKSFNKANFELNDEAPFGVINAKAGKFFNERPEVELTSYK